MFTVLVLDAGDLATGTDDREPVALRSRLAGEGEPDVVVLDVREDDATALTASVAQALPDARLLVIVPADDGELGVACVRAGAAGAVAATDARDGLYEALGRLADGHAVFGEATRDAVAPALRCSPGSPDRLPLTAMQERILSLMATGATNRTIAGRLGLAEKTVKNYATAIYAALGASNRTQAVALWSRLHPTD